MRRSPVIPALLGLLCAGQAVAAERWSVRSGTGGEVLAVIENRAGSSFGIACTSGAPRKELSLQYETETATPGEKEPLAVKVGADEFRFVLDGMSGTAVLAGPDDADRVRRLSARIATAREAVLTVSLAAKGTSETFPLAGARAAIGPAGRDILRDCRG